MLTEAVGPSTSTIITSGATKEPKVKMENVPELISPVFCPLENRTQKSGREGGKTKKANTHS